MSSDLTPIFESPELSILSNGIQGEVLCVAFSGVGKPGNRDVRAEFVRTFEALSQPAVFVIDRNRTWWNHGLVDIVAEKVNTFIDDRFSKVVLIGNSMGGTGALLLADRLKKVSSVLAFAPQASVKRGIIDEDRWAQAIAGISEWTAPSIAPSGPIDTDIDIQVFFGDLCDKDEKHMEFLKTAFPGAEVHVVQGADHSVAKKLRETGKLHKLLSWSIDSRQTKGINMTSDSPEAGVDQELVLKLARSLFAARDKAGGVEDSEWQDHKDAYRKMARQVIRRMDAAGYAIVKATD